MVVVVVMGVWGLIDGRGGRKCRDWMLRLRELKNIGLRGERGCGFF